MNSFIYNIPTKIYFGENQLCHLGEELSQYGKRVMMTYGGGSIKKSGLYDTIKAEIEKAGLTLVEFSGIEPNPRIESVRAGAKMIVDEKIDVLLAVGGGSTIDATKFMSAAPFVDHDPWEFLSRRAPIEKAIPIVTVLTLAATGSEMNKGGVISKPDTKDKLGRSAPALLPKASFLDPTITYSVSKYQTACGSADILNHIMEVYFTTEDDLFMLDTFMEGLMKTVIKYAPVAMAKPDDYEARANLMWASSWAINGFINGGKKHAWSCHPMEHEISGVYDITHGLGLAILTPRWLKYCLNETTLPKYVQYGVNVFGIDKNLPAMEIAQKAIAMTEEFLYGQLGLDDSFTKLGITDEYFALMAKKACKGGVINGFIPLCQQDIENIFAMCL